MPLLVAHSHAFQRAFAGLTERRDRDSDDFWSWRDRMYGMALRITPAQLRAVAAHLYTELLVGGYAGVRVPLTCSTSRRAVYADRAELGCAGRRRRCSPASA